MPDELIVVRYKNLAPNAPDFQQEPVREFEPATNLTEVRPVVGGNHHAHQIVKEYLVLGRRRQRGDRDKQESPPQEVGSVPVTYAFDSEEQAVATDFHGLDDDCVMD